ncbi:MAG TPA: hypothetical protein DEB39_08385, partial [Planctomycetaceae bacterium]|nr:hypothetical protein [Planctomycetaceae bacterium]
PDTQVPDTQVPDPREPGSLLPNPPLPGEFVTATAKGWRWLLKQQVREPEQFGCFFYEGYGTYEHRFYTHAQCTIALCELYAMSGNEEYREPARRAVEYCLKNQSVSGGWRYHPNAADPASDVSVTGWVVLALQSALAAGLEVPPENLRRIDAFLDSVAREGGSRYRYSMAPGERVTTCMTAEALLCRELLGWEHEDSRLRAGLDWLIQEENLVRFDEARKRDVYYWYYATQALHHYGGEPWAIWNERMRTELPKHQVAHGKEEGSWSPKQPVRDLWGEHYGRLYTTCLSILMLEVYYRHLPVYAPQHETTR